MCIHLIQRQQQQQHPFENQSSLEDVYEEKRRKENLEKVEFLLILVQIKMVKHNFVLTRCHIACHMCGLLIFRGNQSGWPHIGQKFQINSDIAGETVKLILSQADFRVQNPGISLVHILQAS
jgi:hypothetical protein